jgi:three-Cys-motif partner protein
MAAHQFGGVWTDDKLGRVAKYLAAYTTIFRGNPRARFFTTIYIDAFAGTGTRAPRSRGGRSAPLFADVESDPEALQFKAGSAANALQATPGFDRFVFIDSDPRKAADLASLVEQYPDKRDRVTIAKKDGNEALLRLVRQTDWQRHRAVAFLDPYGMAVEWSTIQALADTQAVDLWLLFPLGQAVNRLLLRREIPTGAFAAALTRCFGTDAWREAFYQPSAQGELFGDAPGVDKIASFDSIAAFFRRRLESVFAAVAPTSLPLVNSKNNPLFLLCFAAANARGAPTAIRIANDILKSSGG